jgi:hypothetical protein
MYLSLWDILFLILFVQSQTAFINESALAIYRATRKPIRTLWNVEVGSTPDDQIPRLINGIMNRVRRQKLSILKLVVL